MASHRHVNTANRVKSITNRFEVLSENTTEIKTNLAVKKTLNNSKEFGVERSIQCQVNGVSPLAGGSSDYVNINNSEKEKFGPSCNFGNRKRLKEMTDMNEKQDTSKINHDKPSNRFDALQRFKDQKFINDTPKSKLECKPTKLLPERTKSDGGSEKSHHIPGSSLKEASHNRILSRQCSDPSRKLQRTPAFRCDRSEKLKDSRNNSVSSCEGSADEFVQNDSKINDRSALTRDKLKKLGALLEVKMKEDNFEFSGKSKKSIDYGLVNSKTTLFNIDMIPIETSENGFVKPLLISPIGVTSIKVNENQILNTPKESDDSQIPQHILDQYAKVIKPRNRNAFIKKSPEQNLKVDAVFSDSGVSSESENLISDDLGESEASPKVKSFKSIRDNYEGKSFIKRDDSASRRKQMKRSVEENIHNFEENGNNKRDTLKNSGEREINDTIKKADSITDFLQNNNVECCNGLTDTLKKVLKQPLPVGPPPKKPPRTFAATGDIVSPPKTPVEMKRRVKDGKIIKSPKLHRTKEESKLMLDKIENALMKHEKGVKVLSLRPDKKILSNISDSDDSPSRMNTQPSKALLKRLSKEKGLSAEANPKEIHYMCTEIFDINYSDKENILNSSEGSLNSSDGHSSSTLKQCFNSFNCGSASKISSGYKKFGSFPGSKRTSLTDSCCPCSTSDKAPSRCSIAEDYSSQNLILSTFCSPPKNSDSPKCKKCGYNEKKADHFQCHIGCTCASLNTSHNGVNKEESNSTFFVDHSSEMYGPYGALKKSRSQEHIYAEPFQLLTTAKDEHTDQDAVLNPEKEYSFLRTASVYSGKPPFRRTSTQLEDGFKNRNRDSNALNTFRKSLNCKGMDCVPKLKNKVEMDIFTASDKHGSKERLIADNSAKDTDREGIKNMTGDVSIEAGSRVKDILSRLEGNRRSLKVGSCRNSAEEQSNSIGTFRNSRSDTEEDSKSRWSKSEGDFEDPYSARNLHSMPLHYMSTKIYDIPCTDDQPSHSPTPPPPSIPEIEHIALIRPASFLYGLQNGRAAALQNGGKQPAIPETATKPPIYERNPRGEGFLNSVRPKRPNNLQLSDSRTKQSVSSMRHGRSSPTEADRNQLSRLMTEIYDTVAEACTLDSPGREEESMLGEKEEKQDAEASLKLTRTLTEKRKRYLRRVSSRVGYASPAANSLIPPKASPEIYESFDMTDSAISAYATFPSSRLRSLKAQAEKLSSKTENVPADDVDRIKDSNSAVNDSPKKSDSTDRGLTLDTEKIEDRLFDACVLVGMNYSTGKAYMKSVYPENAALPPQIECLVFPETSLPTSNADNNDQRRVLSSPSAPSDPCDVQCYSLVLTDEFGTRSYGYCRRVLPEGAPFCLPLAYCLLARRRAPGFYNKVLREIESHHGSTDLVFDSILKQLYNSKLPRPNHSITIKQLKSPKRIIYNDACTNNSFTSFKKNSTYRRSLNLEELVQNTDEKNYYSRVKDPKNNLSPDTKDYSINRRRKSADLTERLSPNKPSRLYGENTDLSVMLSMEKLYGKDLKEFQNVLNDSGKSQSDNTNGGNDCSSMNLDGLKVDDLVIEEMRKINDLKLSSETSSSNDVSKSSIDDPTNNCFRREFGSEQEVLSDSEAENSRNVNTVKVINLKRPWEPRLDEDNFSILFDSISVGVLVKVFGTLLLERKVVLICDKLSRLSACIEALQSILYPFIWQHTLISIIPSELRRDILEAPIPILAGLLIDSKKSAEKQSKSKTLPASSAFLRDDAKNEILEDLVHGLNFEEGMLIEISNSDGNTPAERVLLAQGDEATLLPPLLAKTLKAALHIGPPILTSANPSDDHTRKTRNVLIAEAFLRFFVDLIGDYGSFLTEKYSTSSDVTGQMKTVGFERENFIKGARSKHVQYFLDWFTETAMFRHFIDQSTSTLATVGNAFDHHLPYPDYYDVFREKISQRNADDALRKSGCKSAGVKGSGNNLSKGNYKMIMNKKVKVWRDKLRDLVN